MQNKDFRPSDQRFEDIVEHTGSSPRPHQLKERISNHHRCRRHQQQLQHHNHQSVLNPQVFRYLRDFKLSFPLNLSNQVLVNPSSKLLKHSNQFRSEEESGQNQNLRIHQRLQQCFRTSRKIIFPSLRIRPMQIIRKLHQKKSCFKVSFFRNGIKGISRDIQQIRSRKQSQKSSSKSVLKVMMPMIRFLLVISVKKDVAPSLSQGAS